MSCPILLEPEQQSYDEYHVSGLPETFLLDASGQLVEHFVGPRDWDQPRYASVVRRLLAAGSEGRDG